MVSSFPARMSNGDDIPAKCSDVIRRMEDILKDFSDPEIYKVLSECSKDEKEAKDRLLSQVSPRVSGTSTPMSYRGELRGFFLRKEHATDAPLHQTPWGYQLRDSASTSNQNLPLFSNLADDNGRNNEVHQVQRRSLERSLTAGPLLSTVADRLPEIDVFYGVDENPQEDQNLQMQQQHVINGNNYMYQPPLLPYPHHQPYQPPVFPPYGPYTVVQPMPYGGWNVTHVTRAPGYDIPSQPFMVPPGCYDLLPPQLGGGGGWGTGYYQRQPYYPRIQPPRIFRPNQPR